MKTKETVEVIRRTPLGRPIKVLYPANSNAARKGLRNRERVVWAGGTRRGSLKEVERGL